MSKEQSIQAQKVKISPVELKLIDLIKKGNAKASDFYALRKRGLTIGQAVLLLELIC